MAQSHFGDFLSGHLSSLLSTSRLFLYGFIFGSNFSFEFSM